MIVVIVIVVVAVVVVIVVVVVVVVRMIILLSCVQVTGGTCFLPAEIEPVNTPDGPITPVPVGIRPVMTKHRIEVRKYTLPEHA